MDSSLRGRRSANLSVKERSSRCTPCSERATSSSTKVLYSKRACLHHAPKDNTNSASEVSQNNTRVFQTNACFTCRSHGFQLFLMLYWKTCISLCLPLFYFVSLGVLHLCFMIIWLFLFSMLPTLFHLYINCLPFWFSLFLFPSPFPF